VPSHFSIFPTPIIPPAALMLPLRAHPARQHERVAKALSNLAWHLILRKMSRTQFQHATAIRTARTLSGPE